MYREGPGFAGVALAVLSAGTFGLSGIFASALISAGRSPAAAAMARLGGGAFLLAVPAVVQLRGRWVLLRREAGRIVLYGLVAIAGGQAARSCSAASSWCVSMRLSGAR